MKKFWIWICMITCIFGLTACGNEEVLSQRDRENLNDAADNARVVVQILSAYMDNEESVEFISELTPAEIEFLVEKYNNMQVDGYGFSTAVESFDSATDSVGSITNAEGYVKFGEVTSRIKDNQIIVEVEVLGTNKNAIAEVIFSNDLFLKLESASLNPESSMGEMMADAALNTLIGMGTVFAVLILISLIISCFKIIPTLQKKAADRKAEKKVQKAGVSQEIKAESPVVQSSVEESQEDDLELAAVIAAAIAAYEGSASADGYVVRSIRRRWS